PQTPVNVSQIYYRFEYGTVFINDYSVAEILLTVKLLLRDSDGNPTAEVSTMVTKSQFLLTYPLDLSAGLHELSDEFFIGVVNIALNTTRGVMLGKQTATIIQGVMLPSFPDSEL